MVSRANQNWPEGTAYPINGDDYELALDSFRKAAADYRAASLAYRNRTIGDDEFLAARAKFNTAQFAADVAEKKLRERAARHDHECPTCGDRCRCTVPREYCVHCA